MGTRTTPALSIHDPGKIVRVIFTAGENMKRFASNLRVCSIWMVLALLLTLSATPASAQKKKNKKNDTPTPQQEAEVKSALPALPDSQAVDQAVGEALGYWQIGDIDSLHKYYADDVVVVSGAWEPPVIGWDNFVKAYQAQRAQAPNGRIDRSNTVIKVNGNSAWATYQFIYSVNTEGRTAVFHGHTTVVLSKLGDRWVIALNHSSVIDSPASASTATATSASPAKP